MNPAAASGGDVHAVLAGFRETTVKSGEIGPWYRVGVGAVAVAMVILPLLYLALVVCAGWAIVWYAQHGATLLDGVSGRAFILGYCGPLFVGAVLLFFLVKPLFARPPKAPQPVQITREEQPAVWALVEHICAAVRAPVPRSIAVDCDVNASASFEPGLGAFTRGDLRLTIGLPLVTGLTLEQLAGVLAHEFGHFAQGGGMRLSNLIRRVSYWFARVVHERDTWDQHLIALSETGGWISLVGWIARLFVWLGRRVLWCLMWVGFVISSYLLRQMEFDADGYQARLVGSGVLAATSERIMQLSVGSQRTWQLVNEQFQIGRLPADVPQLVSSCTRRLPPEILAQLDAARTAEQGGLFDTHPTMAARIAAAQRLGETGIYSAPMPAAAMFNNLPELAHRATRHHYAALAGVELAKVAVVDNAEIEGLDDLRTRHLARCHESFAGVVGIWLPLPLAKPAELPEPSAARLRELVAHLPAAAADAKPIFDQWSEQRQQADQQAMAAALLSAGQSADARGVATASALKDGSTAYAELDERRQRAATTLTSLAPFGALCAETLRHACALRLASTTDPAARAPIELRWRVLQQLAGHSGDWIRLREIAGALGALLQNMQGKRDASDQLRIAQSLASEAQGLLNRILPDVVFVECPFPEGGAGSTMKDHLLVTAADDEHAVITAIRGAQKFVERADEAYRRIVGNFMEAAEPVANSTG